MTMNFKRIISNFINRADRKVAVTKVFFVLSTGRCGTKYLSNLLNLASNAVVLHEPPPGGERINPIAYELYVKNKERFNQMRVSDFSVLEKHGNIYQSIDADIFGDCYNSFYPFAIAFYHFFREKGINIQFIHLVRHPFDCCSSILRAEGQHGIEKMENFGIRANLISQSNDHAEIASDVWISINHVISYQTKYIETLSPGTTKLVHIENMNKVDNIIDLFNWLKLVLPDTDQIKQVVQDESDDIKHSHQLRLDEIGIPKVTNDDLNTIREKTAPLLKTYSY